MPTDVIIDPTNGQIYWNNGGGGNQESISIKGDALNAISFVGYSGQYSPGSAPGGAQTLATVNDSGGTNAFVPGTSGFDLGSDIYRWKLYATTGNFSNNTGTTSLFTGAVIINGGIAISGGASIGQTLFLYGVGTASTSYTGLRAGSVITNTLYTLPITYPGAGTSVLQSDTSGVMTWVPMTATSASSGGTVSSGTQYQIAGYYSGTGASVSGSATLTNNTAIGQVQILHTTASTGTSTGALQVAGGVGISGRLSFNQASFGTTGISSLPTMAMIGQTGDPIYLSILEDNSISFEGSQGQLFSISPNLTTGYIWAVNDISGVPLLRSNVNGNSFIAEFGGNLGIGQTNPTFKLDVKGSFGLASSNDALYNFIFSNSAASGSNSLQIRSANSLRLYSSDNNFYTAFKSRASADKTYLLPATDGSDGQFLQTDGNQNLSWATATGGAGGGSTGVGVGGQYEVAVYPGTGASVLGYSSLKNDFVANVVSISHATASTNFGNGALTVSGGVGIGGSLFVGGTGASISGLTILNSAIINGVWNSTAISTQYGGTGQNLSGASGILTISSGTVSNSTTSSALSGLLSDETGSGVLVFNTRPSFGTGVTTGDTTFAVFNTTAQTINAFGAATAISIGAATGKATFNSTDNSTTVNTGSLVVSGGAGFAKSVSIGGYLQLFNVNNYTAFVSTQSGVNTTYTLPSTSPATGSSVLQSTSAGVMSWVPMVASSSGAGSGTVAIPDAQFRLAYYAGTGASVSSTNLITAVGTGVSILGATNATSNINAALTVVGGLGITGNAFIGGTTVITSSQSSSSTVSGALSVTGGFGLVGNAFIGGTSVHTSSQPSSGTNSGSVTLAGGIGIAGNAFIGGTTNIISSVASIGINSGALVVSGGVGIGGSLYTATGSSSSISGVILANNTISASTYNKVTINAPATSATLQLANGSTLITSGAYSLTLTTSGTTDVTFPTGTKTLVATDVTSLTSLTSASSLNTIGIITSGTWAGSQITSFYGGTGFSGYATGDLLVGFGNTLAKLPASPNTGYVLTSTGAGSVPTWQTVPPAAASSVAVSPTVVNSQFSLTIVNSSSGTGLGLSTVSSLVVNPSNGIVSLSGLAVTSTTQSTTSSSGALIVTGGASVGQTLSVGGSLNIFNSTNYTGFRFAGNANTTYTLPSSSPASIGASYLSSSTTGVMAWVAAPTGGSATPGGSNKQIQYNNSNAFGGASGFEYTTGGIAVTVSVFSPSGTGYTSGLWIHAINGSTTRVGIGLSNPAYELEILGEISATNKSFVIDHPTKSGMKLRYGSLEGPENGVYVRGELKGTNIIEVPDHWIGLVYPDSYTVHLTPIGRFSQLYVEKIENYNVFVADTMMCPIHCYYSVWAERKDIPKLVTEYEAQ